MRIRELSHSRGFVLEMTGVYITFDSARDSYHSAIMLYRMDIPMAALVGDAAIEFEKKWESIKNEIN